MTASKAGKGTTFTRNGGTCAELKKLGPPKVQRDTIDATNFDSQNYEEFILGLYKTGDATLSFNSIPTDVGQSGLKDDMDNGTLQNFAIAFPFAVTKTLGFSGYVTSWEQTADYNGIMMLNVSIKVSGAITWA